jgi:hypothetical protein
MPTPKFTKAVKAHFGIQARGRPANADLLRLFGTTNYDAAANVAKERMAAAKAAQRVTAYEKKKEYNRLRNREIRRTNVELANEINVFYRRVRDLPDVGRDPVEAERRRTDVALARQAIDNAAYISRPIEGTPDMSVYYKVNLPESAEGDRFTTEYIPDVLRLAKRRVVRMCKNSRLSIQAIAPLGRVIWSVKYDFYTAVAEAFLTELESYLNKYEGGEHITAIRFVWRQRGENRGQGNARCLTIAKAKWKEVSVVTVKNCLYAAFYLCKHPELAADPASLARLNITDIVKQLKRRVNPLHKEYSSDADVQLLANHQKAIIHVYNNLYALTKTFTPDRVFSKRSGNETPEFHIRLAQTHYTALIPWELIGGYEPTVVVEDEKNERELKKIVPRPMKSTIDTNIAAWDIEASTTADGDFKAYGVGCAWYGPEQKEEYVQFWGLACLEEFAQWLVDNMARFNKWTFYAHNGGRFDVALLLKESILRKCGLHIKGANAIELNGCWINIPLHDEVGNEIIMKDSLRMLPGSLADLTAQLKVPH